MVCSEAYAAGPLYVAVRIIIPKLVRWSNSLFHSDYMLQHPSAKVDKLWFKAKTIALCMSYPVTLRVRDSTQASKHVVTSV